jgi:hypothetical protein
VLGSTWEYTETDTITLRHTRVCARAHTHTCMRKRMRVCLHTANWQPVKGGRVPVHACVRVRARFLLPFHRPASSPMSCACVSVCVCVCVCASRGCAGAVVARRGPAVSKAWPAAPGGRVRGCVRFDRPVVARVGRRGDVDKPYDPRAVGCARRAHVCDWRRRRHLRHRRRRRQDRLQGRVGERQRR